MDPTPVYSGYSIFFGVIEGFDPPQAPLPLPPPEATSLRAMVDHPAAIVQVGRIASMWGGVGRSVGRSIPGQGVVSSVDRLLRIDPHLTHRTQTPNL